MSARGVDLLRAATRRLAAAGMASPRLDAELLLARILDCDRTALLLDPDRVLSPDEETGFAGLVARRAEHEPVAHLLGRREFHGHDFIVSPATLIPRPDSETLVEAALALHPETDREIEVLDLGTGSGCLLLALLAARPRWRGAGSDLSEEALDVARRNATALGLAARARFYAGDWWAALPPGCPPFDLVIANPPYIASAQIAGLMPDVARHEPRLALDGGADGLAACRAIADRLADHLVAQGAALIEIGAGQAAAAEEIFAAAGLAIGPRLRDLGGHERVISLRRPGCAEKWLGI